jgi:peptidoglycan-N-acetylmuramic acid deacetylase
MNLKKTIVFIVACVDVVLIALSPVLGISCEACFFQAAAHTAGTQYGWYYMPRTDGLQPRENPEFAFVEKYDVLSMGGPDEKVIYITFDAGYENGNAAKMLDALKAHRAQAAFFLVGHYIKNNPEIVRRMADEGHLICSHSMNHNNMAAMEDFAEFSKELTDLETLFYEQTGKKLAKFFRPPEGNFSETLLQYAQQCGYTTVFWSFAYKDWYNDNQPSVSAAFDTIISRTHPGEIALLHLTSKTNAEVLDAVLTRWEEMGYRFGSLYELTSQSGPDV